ncbi:hypothetical protein RQM65_13870 [Pricia sp. S334]|uniref:Periplasmic heavy metal sensor n=1 Tax=Pricia mediterranea TaxID=3076079 RepID=A0ABU3L8F1_9FLAO|nr:hypothetical protein [Pricia sp. S334]MDT7829757.1 hypothetical protein [Pricia sp. S334]
MTLRIFLTTAFALISFSVAAQTCRLDIGGKDVKSIIEVFQLRETQVVLLDSLRTELSEETGRLEVQIEELLAKHPQSTEEELVQLADKYKVLQQRLLAASYESDKTLLSAFNAKQYQRYLELCRAALRMPIEVTPMVYGDSSDPEQH